MHRVQPRSLALLSLLIAGLSLEHECRHRPGNHGRINLRSIAQLVNHRCPKPARAAPLTYLRKIAVPAKSPAKAGCARHAVLDQGLAAVVPFLDQTLAHAKPMALDGRPWVGPH